MFPSATGVSRVDAVLWIPVDRPGTIGLCPSMHRRVSLLLLPLLAGTAIWLYPEPEGRPARVVPAKVDRSKDLTKAVAAEPGFRELVEAAMTLPPKESVEAVTRLLERGVKGSGVKDAAWFFERYQKERSQGRPRLILAHWITVLKELARKRPAEAARLLEAKERLGEPEEGRTLMEVWAGSRPLDAIAWAKQGGEEREDWFNSNGYILMTVWAACDLDGLLAWLEDGNEQLVSASAAMKAFEGQRGIAAVREWLETHGGEGSALTLAVRMAAAELVATEILEGEGKLAAISWVESREAPEERWHSLHQVVPRLVVKEPQEVVEWLERLSPQKRFPMWLAETSMNQWAARDLKAAGEWLNRHRGSAAANSYIWGYALQVAMEDPEAALEWSKELKGGLDGGFGGSMAFIAAGDGSGWVPGGHYNSAYLEKMIAVTASAAAFVKDPEHPGTGDVGLLMLNYMPALVQESPGSEPQLRMLRNPPGSCTMFFGGKWTYSFPLYQRQPDGSLRPVPAVEAE
jgi:hypothetical protein